MFVVSVVVTGGKELMAQKAGIQGIWRQEISCVVISGHCDYSVGLLYGLAIKSWAV